MATIRQCVDISVLEHVANDTNAHEMWHKLSGLYERKNALNKTSLMRKIVRLKYRDGESIVEHINTFMNKVSMEFESKSCFQILPLFLNTGSNKKPLVVCHLIK